MKITTKQLVQTALLLAICIASQFLKNLSPYITGPIVNTTIIIATLATGLYSGLLISIIAPITAYFIAASPIMAGIPQMLLVIMAGNSILALCTWLFTRKIHFRGSLPVGLLTGAVVKAAFMGAMVIWVVLPLWSGNIVPYLPKPEALQKVLATARITFSFTQLITGLTGGLISLLIWMPLQKYLKNGEQ